MLSRTLLILVYPINRVGKTLLWEIDYMVRCKSGIVILIPLGELAETLAEGDLRGKPEVAS